MIITPNAKEPNYTVVWNGSKDHPAGRLLFADEYPPVAPDAAVRESAHDLSTEQISVILQAYADGHRISRIGYHLRISTELVQFVVTAATAGVLRRGGQSCAA